MPHIRTVDEKADIARPYVAERIKPLSSTSPAFVLFASHTNGERRATTVHASGSSFDEVWNSLLARLRETRKDRDSGARFFRVDWVDEVSWSDWRDLEVRLTKTKRNYFRDGISLDPQFNVCFLEAELNANAMLYGGPKIPHSVVNQRNFAIYAHKRFGKAVNVSFAPDEPVCRFTTSAVYVEDDGSLVPLHTSGLDTGRRQVAAMDAAVIEDLVRQSSRYLSEQVQESGQFIYGYHPAFDRQIPTYNALRHASTTFSMIEAYEAFPDARLATSIERSLHYLTRELIKTTEIEGTSVSFLVDLGDEIKLGGNAVAILALTKYASTFSANHLIAIAEQLARGIVMMQNQDGSFKHVLEWPHLATKTDFRTIYYDGEAAYGLLRLYDMTKDTTWLAAAELAFSHFIRAGHHRYHDHWLSYGAYEMYRHTGNIEYLNFSIANFHDHLPFVRDRITTFPTLLELMMAANDTIELAQASLEGRSHLSPIDMVAFREAIGSRAEKMLNGFFWPEVAMFFACPIRIVGAFFIRHHAFRVRIDDIEHNLSGFVALHRYLKTRSEQDQSLPDARYRQAHSILPWSADDVQAATAGRWLIKMPPNWRATGVSVDPTSYRDGNIILGRSPGDETGISARRILELPSRPSAIISSETEAFRDLSLPIFQVANTEQALFDLASYARSRMNAKVLAVTGSAGKTSTVAMLREALSQYGEAVCSRLSANLPRGVSWNLASFPLDTEYAVLELAVGRMGQSARIARPDVSLFLNVYSAHLREGTTTADIARTKSAIFSHMNEGGTAVINDDMRERDLALQAAREANCRVILFGKDPSCEFRLVAYDGLHGVVKAEIRGTEIEYTLPAIGEHMAYNSLGVLACVAALGLPLDKAVGALEQFSSLPGRGLEKLLKLNSRSVTLIDDAYNANPGSMLAAIDVLTQSEKGSRRIAVLGEMLELGAESAASHAALIGPLSDGRIDKVCLVGEVYRSVWDRLPDASKGFFVDTSAEVSSEILNLLQDGDVLLVKGSHGSKLHEVVAEITALGTSLNS